MNRCQSFALGVLLWLAVPTVHGQAAPKGYDAFSLVRTRNIFDSNRRAARNEPPPDSRSSVGAPRPSSFTLTGTMVAEGRSLAFFSGSRSEYSKVIPVGEVVAGYKVVAITPMQAELERDGKRMVLAVGHRFQIEGSSDEPSGPETSGPEASPAPTPPDPNAAATPAPAPTSDKTEILRRMMERRQKEMSK